MQITIPAKVVNGHLQHEVSLAELEGQELIATLTFNPKNVASEQKTKCQPLANEDDTFDPEPPEWLEVEKDLYFPIEPRRTSLGTVTISEKRGRPCIILPEELPDE